MQNTQHSMWHRMQLELVEHFLVPPIPASSSLLEIIGVILVHFFSLFFCAVCYS